MASLRWTLQALEDIEGICTYFARDSEHYGKILANQIFEEIQKLIKYPQIGRKAAEVKNKSVRELIVGNFRIVYRFREDIVEILSVIHGSKSLDPLKL